MDSWWHPGPQHTRPQCTCPRPTSQCMSPALMSPAYMSPADGLLPARSCRAGGELCLPRILLHPHAMGHWDCSSHSIKPRGCWSMLSSAPPAASVAEPHRHGDPQNEGGHLPGPGGAAPLGPCAVGMERCTSKPCTAPAPAVLAVFPAGGQAPGQCKVQEAAGGSRRLLMGKGDGGGRQINPACGRPGQQDVNSGRPCSKPALPTASEAAGLHAKALMASLCLW